MRMRMRMEGNVKMPQNDWRYFRIGTTICEGYKPNVLIGGNYELLYLIKKTQLREYIYTRAG